MTQNPAANTRRVEMILKQVESLPTLPSVAMKLLQLTSSDESNAPEVVELIRSDPSLTAKILALCKSAGRGVRSEVTTIDRAVVLLGFEAIRNAVLSIKVYEVFSTAGKPNMDDRRFATSGFWRHSLAVAIASELICDEHKGLDQSLEPDEAFVCGLMHDMGKMALFHVLPKSYQRVMELTDHAHANIMDVEKKLIGLDHQMAGKRLGEYWQLPQLLRDVMWLHNSAYELIPEQMGHRRLIGVVGLADMLVRRQHLGYSGNYVFREPMDKLAEKIGLDPAKIESVVVKLHEETQRRAQAMGLGDAPSRQLFLESIMQANVMLGRLNSQLEAKRRDAAFQSRILSVIDQFYDGPMQEATGADDVLAAVIESAVELLGEGFYATLYQPQSEAQWEIGEYTLDGRLKSQELVDPPPSFENLAALGDEDQSSVDLISLFSWLTDYLKQEPDQSRIRILPLPGPWGAVAAILHDREQLPPTRLMQPLLRSWGAAVAAMTRTSGSNRISEELTDLNRELASMQQQLTDQQAMARVGQMAAGAAHEMNNPLMVITGRAQMLAARITRDAKAKQMAQQIVEQSQKLSDLITALHLFADPPDPELMLVSPPDVVNDSVRRVRDRKSQLPQFQLQYGEQLKPVRTDREHLAASLSELILNAAEANPKNSVNIRVAVDALNGRLNFEVVDDGEGMDSHTLEHAFDPFFSAKPAGRQTGLGLARARRLAESLGGDIELISFVGQGTTARLSIPLED